MSLQILGIIPARGGSKGIPRKNIAPLADKPMIAWTIEVALSSPSLSRVLVTTDDQQIRDLALALGSEAPFLRPAELANDDTPSIDVVLHVVEWLAAHENYRPDYLMLLQPTSPLRTVDDIEGAIRLANDRRCDSVVSVAEAVTHPYWMKRIASDGTLENFIAIDTKFTRRQDLPPAFGLNGAIYLVRTNSLLAERTFYPGNTLPYVMPRERSLDIDSQWDLFLVDLVLRNRNHL